MQTEPISNLGKPIDMQYFNERTEAFALKIMNFKEYAVALNLHDVFEKFTAPQSFMYLNDEF